MFAPKDEVTRSTAPTDANKSLTSTADTVGPTPRTVTTLVVVDAPSRSRMFRFLATFWLRAAFCLAAAALARFWRSVAICTDGVPVEAASNRACLAGEAAFLVPQSCFKIVVARTTPATCLNEGSWLRCS